ncbi:MAG: argininosuccinate lyase [Leptospirales bacterium]|jgi:argininosuccinate lyase
MTKTGAKNQLWAGRSDGEVADITVRMGESISLDIQLYREDIRGSVAHARMLEGIGVLRADERAAIENGLRSIKQEIEAGDFDLRPELEDIHTHVENRLTELIGDAGKKLHTARSRNDQVAVDTHLFVRRACAELGAAVGGLCDTLLERATQKSTLGIVLPGYTHLQVAQPIRLSHHLLAHYWAFSRDITRFARANETANALPLGSGAMAGVNYATDREFLRRDLSFAEISPNSMDAVASRDHILDFLYACAVFMTHASRLSEELILWNSVEFGFITLPDALTTGSSIMPQKKNPDLAELTRGKTGRVQGNLLNLLTNIKSLPLTYNRDLQEDRFVLLDSYAQTGMAIEALTAMLAGVEFHGDRMRASLDRGFAQATDLADALVSERDVPFREAHHLVGALVRACVDAGTTLAKVSAQTRSKINECFADDDFYFRAVSLENSADKKVSYGGTGQAPLDQQIESATLRSADNRDRDWNAPDLDF